MDWDEAEKLCICRMCPSYFECGEKLPFCMWESGKSKCIKMEVGCVCPGCPGQVRMGYQHDYYCTKGGEKELSGR
jgi:hypothetical protein